MASAYACVMSHIGNSRDNQEDNFILSKGVYLTQDFREKMGQTRTPLVHGRALNGQGFLVAVSDGMGGHACGELASMMTVEYLSRHYDELLPTLSSGEQALSAQITQLNSTVFAMSETDRAYHGMGATLCGVIGDEYTLLGFNVGDSRLYQFCNGTLKQLSTDHTEGQRLLNMRLLTEEEVQRFPRRKVLHKYIGYSGQLIPDVFPITGISPGSILLLCSDGLSDVMSDSEISQILSGSTGLEDRAKLLVNSAVARNQGHGDNITVILIQF